MFCKCCGKEIDESGKFCPNCGHECVNASSPPEHYTPSSHTSETQTHEKPFYQKKFNEFTASDKKKYGVFVGICAVVIIISIVIIVSLSSNGGSTTNPSSNMTMSQRNAVNSAKSYLNTMAFSRSGLISQLEYEGYSHSDSVFAVDYTNTNWNEQAVKMAKTYLKTMSFSRQALIEQLEYEGFTHEQAVYGVNGAGYT